MEFFTLADHTDVASGDVSAITGFTYDGLGDGTQQTVSGTTTTYVNDLSTSLTQVLDDGTESYIFGLGRLAQVNDSTGAVEYFLGDALASVRQ